MPLTNCHYQPLLLISPATYKTPPPPPPERKILLVISAPDISPRPNVLKWIRFIRDPYSQSSSRPRRIQSCMDDWNNSNSHPLDEWGFAQPQNLSKNSYMILLRTLIFTCVLITSHPLKTFRITENKTQLLYGMKWYICAPSLMVQYFSRKDRRPSFHVVNR